MQSCQPLIDAQIFRRLGQRRHQRSKRLRGHVIGNEKFGVRQSCSDCQCHLIRITLVDERGGCFQFVDQHSALFRTDQACAGGFASQSRQHLLIIAGVHLVLRFQLRELQIIIARFFEASGLHRRVRQQFVYFGQVRLLSGFFGELKKSLKRAYIFPDVPDQGMQSVHDFSGIVGQQPLEVFFIYTQNFLIMSGSDQRLGITCNGGNIVMHRAQLGSQSACFCQAPTLLIRLHQRLQALGMAIEIRNAFQILYRFGNIAGFKCGAAAHQQCVAIVGIEFKHPLQNFLSGGKLAFGAKMIGSRGKDLPRLVFLVQPDVNLGQAHSHGRVFRVHLQRLLENPHCFFQLT